MQHFRVGDCIGHAEQYAVIREELFCGKCNKHRGVVHLAVFHGILVGIGDTLPEAKAMLNSTHLEKIVLMYHDLYQRYRTTRYDRNRLEGFLEQVVEWSANPDQPHFLFSINSSYFKDAAGPVEVITRFLGGRKADEHHDEGPVY